MPVDIFAISFVVIALWLFLTLIIKKYFSHKFRDEMKLSEFVAFIGLLIFVYSVAAVLVAIFLPKMWTKLVMILFAASPFIIGKFATYEKEDLFSIIQLVCILASIIFVTVVA